MSSGILIELQDRELEQLGTREAAVILERRTNGASTCRLLVAQTYGRSDVATPQYPHVLPHLTDQHTIGVVDKKEGTAWDFGLPVGGEVLALGTNDVLGQAPEAPPGWRRIALPPERGYYAHRSVPASRYKRETWRRPVLRAVGLLTEKGVRPPPRRTLCDAGGQSACYPNGIPPWVHLGFEEPDIDIDWLPLLPKQRAELQRIECETNALTVYVSGRDGPKTRPWTEHMTEVLYKDGPIYLEIPAFDANPDLQKVIDVDVAFTRHSAYC